uniref:Phosphoglycerate kinase n=1 Tax=Eutreptiella gymnastica TaxID=73025 RepID=A0A7S1I9E9_9EUGL|mmetsp:Transcript_140685/g.245037  ORF Transcript_140685/g.245037 Transcript_140685/m.245037 type:complete len:415 (+) Transcript_140685:115-1359(+)
MPGSALGPKLSVDDLDMKDKNVIVRVDFNVPMKDGAILDDFRIKSALPTLEKINASGARLIIMSHMGRPKETGYEEKFSLKPIAAHLGKLMGKPVGFAADCCKAGEDVAKMNSGDILVLENLRFYPGEGSKDKALRLEMARILASYADLYVSDAFGTAHRDAASMTGVPEVMGQGASGYLMKKEIEYFSKALKDPSKPVAAIVGGAKVSDKIQLLDNMLQVVDEMVIGGAMAYTFLKASGKNTGKSMCETEATGKNGKIDILDLARKLLAKANDLGVKMHLPLDHRCATEFKDVEAFCTPDENIPDDMMALDIGPKTEELYRSVLANAKTAIWNGPMGVFEFENFKSGTWGVAKTLADNNSTCLSIVGGGDSASAAEKSGYASQLSHISTGGGASLELLEGKVLPGLAILTDKP